MNHKAPCKPITEPVTRTVILPPWGRKDVKNTWNIILKTEEM